MTITKQNKTVCTFKRCIHHTDVIMGAIASQITSLTIVYSTIYSDADQRKHQSSVSLAFVREIHQGPVNYPHKWPVTRKMFRCDDVIMVIPHTVNKNSDLLWWSAPKVTPRGTDVVPVLTMGCSKRALDAWQAFICKHIPTLENHMIT